MRPGLFPTTNNGSAGISQSDWPRDRFVVKRGGEPVSSQNLPVCISIGHIPDGALNLLCLRRAVELMGRDQLISAPSRSGIGNAATLTAKKVDDNVATIS